MSGGSPRDSFANPIAADYFDLRALQIKTAQGSRLFGDVVIKELLDNALDAAEQGDGTPEIEVTTETRGDVQYVTVADNGSGMKPEDIARILDFSVLVSSKSAYRSPTRGLQGNAWKTLIGIPYVLGVKEPIVIEARGLRHEVSGSLDPARNVVISHPEPSPSPSTTGTSVTVPLPAEIRTPWGSVEPFEADAARWVANYAVLNPHAEFSYLYGTGTDGRVFYKPQVGAGDGWVKPLESDKLVPAWYDTAAFERLIFSYIGKIRAGGKNLSVGEFIRKFDGLTSTAKAKQIKARLPGIENLGDFDGRSGDIRTLLSAMQAAARAPKPEKLGHVPEDHYRECVDRRWGVVEWQFRRKRYVDLDGLPWVFEVAAAVTEQPAGVVYAVNYGVSFGDPFGRSHLSAADIYTQGAGGFLAESDAAPHESNGHLRAAIVHVITPAAEYKDPGKVALDVSPQAAAAFAATIAAATKLFREDKARRERDARRADRHAEQRRRAAESKKISQKEAVFAVMQEAIDKQRGGTDLPFSSHSLFYVIRPLAHQYAGRVLDLDAKYVEQTLIPEWQHKHGVIEGLYYDPRGELHEPHSGRTVRLGTREVATYVPPEWTYNKILVVEKKGLWPVLEAAQLAERYDMAIIMSEGFSSTGCRQLLASMPPGDVEIFSVHDADHAGYNLSEILGEETRRMPGHRVKIHDIGLTVADSIALGLESEEYTRKKALPARLVPRLTETEAEWFGGTVTAWKKGKPSQWRCRRTELNAFTSPGLIAYIEDGLARHGAAGKVIPPGRVRREKAWSAYDSLVTQRVESAIADLVDADVIIAEALKIAHRRARMNLTNRAVRRRINGSTRSWRDDAAAEAATRLYASGVPFDWLVRQRVLDRLRELGVER